MLDLDRDPVPGDPFEVKELARKLGDFADDVASALRSVKGLNGDTAVQEWAGLSGDAYRSQFGELPGRLDKLERSYRLASGALDDYWPKLETAQADADRALAQGRTARQELDSAQSQLTNADAWVKRAQDKSKSYQDDPKPNVPPPSAEEVRAAARNATDANNAHTTASTAVHNAQAKLDAAKQLAADAAQLRDDAASTAQHALHEASDAGIKNKHWWEKAVDWVADHWDDIIAVCKVIVAVLGIVVLIIGGPLAWLVLAAAVLVLADTVMKYLQGKASLWDVLFAALDCIPMFKGLTTAGGLLKMARELPALLKSGKALENIANSIRKGAGAIRSASRSIKSLFTCGDPIDMATGEMVMGATDVELPGVLPLVLERTHRSGYRGGRWFGASWASTLDQRLWIDDQGVRFTTADGMVLHYPVPEADRPVMPVEGPRWPLSWDGTPGGTMTVAQPEDGRTLHFRPLPQGALVLTEITDRNSNRIVITYDESGAPVEVAHSGGYRVAVTTADGRITALHLASPEHPAEDRTELMRYGYDAGRLTAVVNSSGLPLTFAYDDHGRIVRWEDRVGGWYTYTYDAEGRCVRTTGADGALAYTYAYHERPRVTEATDALGHTTTFAFNDHYQLTCETDPLGRTTRWTWDRYDRLRTLTDPLGRTTTRSYDADGNVVAVTRPDGSSSHVAYDERGLPVRVTGPDGSVWQRAYDERGNLRAETEPDGGTTSYAYDVRGRLVAITDPVGGVTRIEPNEAGLPVALTDPAGGTDRYERDGFGRIVAMRDPVGGLTRLGWTVEGLPAWSQAPDGARESWTYDADGNPAEYRDPAGAVTRTVTAAFGLPASRTDADGTVHYTYDKAMRLVAVTNPAGAAWSYGYDAAGRLTHEVDFDGRAVEYHYDAAGQLVGQVNGAGQAVRYTRDALGRVVESRTDAATATFAYDAANRLLRAANPDAELTYGRDAAGRILTETVNGRTVASTYDGLGRRTRRSTPAGVVSEWEFDTADRLTALCVAGVRVDFGHDGAGRETRRTFGRSASLTRAWDQAHRLRSETWATPAGEGMRRWEYDRSGTVTRAAGELDGTAYDRSFTLDAMGRVTAVEDLSAAGTAGAGERYRYDVAGNVVEGRWGAGADHAAGGDREVSGTLLARAGRTRYTYDAQGRVVRKVRALLSGGGRTWTYSWDAHDRLTEAVTPDGTRWRYLYDPLGRRIAKLRLGGDGAVAERTDFVWDGAKLAEQSVGGAAGTTTWEWQPGAARPLVQTESGPAGSARAGMSGETGEPRETGADASGQDEIDRRFYAIVSDLVGTPTHLVDADGRVAWRAETSLWGAALWDDAPPAPAAGGTTCPLRFPGQYHDAETGLHYNYRRYYDPETARYQSPDPLGLAPAPNHHGYVPNPLTWSDPLGLAPCEIFYRVMSAKEFGGLGPLGEITVKGTENFVTQEAGYVRRIAETFARRGGRNAQKYTHLVRYQMQPGTRDALIAAARGSGDNIEAIREAYGLHLDEIGQSLDFVHLKLEREGLNFGLRPGSVDVFNSRILGKTHTLL
ncbi:DUF6531 domain-containing protein [Actinacidiphila alni]|uniref:DUF6531 domain-containing protein n=1 Tax=Actinacidiphila alni TaxID=380248 RepID=UPI0033E3C93D